MGLYASGGDVMDYSKAWWALAALPLAGCGVDDTKLEHKKIELRSVSGEVVTMVCPVFSGKPLGSHGRECYMLEVEQ